MAKRISAVEPALTRIKLVNFIPPENRCDPRILEALLVRFPILNTTEYPSASCPFGIALETRWSSVMKAKVAETPLPKLMKTAAVAEVYPIYASVINTARTIEKTKMWE